MNNSITFSALLPTEAVLVETSVTVKADRITLVGDLYVVGFQMYMRAKSLDPVYAEIAKFHDNSIRAIRNVRNQMVLEVA
jgi:hypothetical protein